MYTNGWQFIVYWKKNIFVLTLFNLVGRRFIKLSVLVGINSSFNMKLGNKNILEALTLSHEEQFFDLVMIRLAVIADDAEYEAFGHEPTSTLDKANLRILLRSKFCWHGARNAAVWRSDIRYIDRKLSSFDEKCFSRKLDFTCSRMSI